MLRNLCSISSVSLVVISVIPSFAHALGPIDGDIYGRLNVTYQYENNAEDGKVWKLESNASRLGFKGATPIEDGLSLIYQIEYGVEVDDGDKNGQTVSQRDTFVGVNGTWGQLKGGKLTVPFKESKGDFDRFNDLQGELGKIIDGEERVDNVLQYDTHKLLGPWVGTLAIVPGENTDDGNEDGPADGMSGSLVLNDRAFYLGLGFNANIKQQDQFRVVGTWKWEGVNDGTLSVGGLYQYSEISERDVTYIDGKEKAVAFGVSSAYSFQRYAIKAQYMVSDRSLQLSDARQFSLEFDRQLGERSTLYCYFTQRDADEKNRRNSYIAVGLRHPF